MLNKKIIKLWHTYRIIQPMKILMTEENILEILREKDNVQKQA